jgi:alpha,alpha-trehalase
MSGLDIADYAMLSDCHSVALVSREGSIDWLCAPRFDSPSVFGRILDDSAGHWSIRPGRGVSFHATRQYLDDTLVLETTFHSTTGTVALTDALAVGRNERGHDLGAGADGVLLRHVVGVDGEVEFESCWAPRPRYGLVTPAMRSVDGGVASRGPGNMLTLSSSVANVIKKCSARARFTVRTGDSITFATHYRGGSEDPEAPWTETDVVERLDDTAEGWRTWSALHQAYEGPWADLVRTSGRVLYGLTYFPTGAIVAAPTTSLPESPGGTRNWDYRYSWVRDAAFTLQALWIAACPHEANKYFDFTRDAATASVTTSADLPIMFGVGGERELTESELSHLSGWRNSAPVRVGNQAWSQRQLDVYGEILDAANRLRVELSPLPSETRTFLATLADIAVTRWREKDRGIWETRGEPQHFLYSKLMCWVALDRAVALAKRLGKLDGVVRWKTVRDEVADAIMSQGWSDDIGSFTQSFESETLDASSLMIPIVGFLPASHPRVRATIDTVAKELTDERGLVSRYRAPDGFDGEEGAFLLCTFWLAEAHALAGDVERARATFEAAIAHVNDVGLLSEEVDRHSGELLGNFPQACSHVGLVNAARAIELAERRHSRNRG